MRVTRRRDDAAYSAGACPHAVRAALALLSESDFDRGLNLLYSNVRHQGTICEATEHAVPFLVCFAAGLDSEDRRVEPVICLLADIRQSASHLTENGSARGAYGVDVGPNTIGAFVAGRSALERIDRTSVVYGDIAVALVEVVDRGNSDTSSLQTLATQLETHGE